MKEYPLISAVIIHYNNGDYIFETISSVLSQDYPNIELLISDDCSPNGFDVDRIIEFINTYRKDNLKRVIINENRTNIGTVKNLEKIREKEQGEYELLIAADDVWYDEHVFSAFAERFDELGPQAEWIVSQVEMRDEKLARVQELFVKTHIIELISKGKFKELLSEEAKTVCLPSAGTALRRTFFQKVNNLGESYDLIEDYPMQLRALRMGIPVYYLNIVSVMHRHGGISHGNQQNSNSVYFRYIKDFIKIFEMEILQHEKDFQASDLDQIKKRYRWYCDLYNNNVKPDSDTSIISNSENRKKWKFSKDTIKLFKNKIISFSNSEKIKNNIKLLFELLLIAAFIQIGQIRFAKLYLLEGIKYAVMIIGLVIGARFFSYTIVLLYDKLKKWRN